MKNLFKIIVVILFGSFCLSCNAEQGDHNYSEINAEKESNFRSSLQLPKNATITYFHEITGSDQLTKSIALMPNENFIDWIIKLHLTLDSFDNNKRYLLGENEKKWNPKSSLILDTAQINFGNGMILNIGYKPENDTQVIVYLVFHGK